MSIDIMFTFAISISSKHSFISRLLLLTKQRINHDPYNYSVDSNILVYDAYIVINLFYKGVYFIFTPKIYFKELQHMKDLFKRGKKLVALLYISYLCRGIYWKPITSSCLVIIFPSLWARVRIIMQDKHYRYVLSKFKNSLSNFKRKFRGFIVSFI